MLKSVGSNWGVTLLQILVLLKLTPFVVDALGPASYGAWVTIVSLTGVLRLLILGVPMASVRYIAQGVAREDAAGTNRAIATCLGVTVGMSAVALATGAALAPFFSATYLDGMPAGLSREAWIAYWIVAVQVAANFALRLPYGIFDAHHDFVTRNAIQGGELLLRLGTTIGLLAWRPSLVLLALVQVLSMLAEFGACWVLIRRKWPHLRLSLAAFDGSLVRGVLSFSVFAMVLNVGTLLAFRTDALVIGAYLPAEDVTRFDLGNKFFEPLTGLVIGIGAVVMPMATRLQTAGAAQEMRDMLLRWSKIALSLVLLVGLYLLVLGPEFLGWWVGEEYALPSGRVLQVLMLSFFLYLPVRGVALPILMGVGRPAPPALALLVMGAVNVGLSLLLVRPFGILGVALGTALPNAAFAAVVLVMACRSTGTPLGAWLRYVVGRPLVGALVPLAFLCALKYGPGVDGIVELLAAGVAMVALFALVWVVFVYRRDPYVDLRGRLAGALRRARSAG